MTMLKFGMVGGAPGSKIGPMHREAAQFDRLAQLTAGCFSRHVEKNAAAGAQWGVDRAHLYSNYREMAEHAPADGLDFVTVVTPNVSHYEICRSFLEAGVNVVCDKPVTTDPARARELMELAERRGLLFAVTYTFAGLPMLQYARELVRRGEIGDVTTVLGEYARQSRLQALLSGNTAGVWRLDPQQCGPGGTIADLGTHLEYMARMVTGADEAALTAQLGRVPNAQVDTNSTVLLRYQNGASGVFWTSQVAAGTQNLLRLRVYGTKGHLEWTDGCAEGQPGPDCLRVALTGVPERIDRYAKVEDFGLPALRRTSRPEAMMVEGFANIYAEFCRVLELKKAGRPYEVRFPTAADGLRGVQFVDACVRADALGSWVQL